LFKEYGQPHAKQVLGTNFGGWHSAECSIDVMHQDYLVANGNDAMYCLCRVPGLASQGAGLTTQVRSCECYIGHVQHVRVPASLVVLNKRLPFARHSQLAIFAPAVEQLAVQCAKDADDGIGHAV
jgi:hypothetical protein